MDRTTAQQGLAPVDGVAAGTQAQLLLADIEPAEHEGIEDFTRRPLVVALGIVAQAQRRLAVAAQVVRGGDVLVIEVARIGVVVPERSTDASTVLLFVDNVGLGEDVDPVGNGAVLVEVAIAVVVVRVGQDCLVLAIHTGTEVVTQRVVETQLQVFVAGIDLECPGIAPAHYAKRQSAHAQHLGNFVLFDFHLVLVRHFFSPLSPRLPSPTPIAAKPGRSSINDRVSQGCQRP
ncbi:hypothetical protein D3C81_1365420 [compost metagenome]